MCSSVKPSCPVFCTSDPAPGVGCFGGQRSPEIYTSSAAERQSSYTASQDRVEVRVEKTHLLAGRAAAQVQIFGLQTFGFSQDGLDLEVDLVGDLWSSKAIRKCVRWWGRWLAHLGLSCRDVHQLVEPLALGVGVEALQGVLGWCLDLGWVESHLRPAAQERHLLCAHTHHSSVMTVFQQLWKVCFSPHNFSCPLKSSDFG